MSTSFPISGPYPGVEYDPSETGGIWHEDREVDGVMYRVTNAYFDGSAWSLKDTSKPGFAVVQNPDGSVGHLYQPPTSSTWTTWQGSPTNTFFNAVDYGLTTTDSMGTINPGALMAALQAAGSVGGGIVYIPAGTYKFDGTMRVSTSDTPPFPDVGIIIAGAGGSTELVQLGNNDTFSISGLTSGRGVRFRDLRITYRTSHGFLSGRAIYVYGSQSITCERVYFRDCPYAFYADAGSVQCGLFDSTIDYSTGSDAAVMVYFSGTQHYVDQCVFRQTPQNTMKNGPKLCIGIELGALTFCSVSNSHLSDFTFAIQIDGGGSSPICALFSDLVIQAWTNAVKILPLSPSDTIHQIFLTRCVLARTDDSRDPASVGVTIDTNGGANSNVSDIFIDSCLCYQWDGPGIQIEKAQNIVIAGGRYGSCASNNGGGIGITGPAADITICGADCTPTVSGYSAQPLAISVTGAVTGLNVRACNLTGYAPGNPISVSATGATLEISDCAGYNDQGTVVSTTAPPSGTAFNGAYFGYYGPIRFYTAPATGLITAINVQGHPTHLLSGKFTVSAGSTPSASVTYTGSPFFLAIGC